MTTNRGRMEAGSSAEFQTFAEPRENSCSQAGLRREVISSVLDESANAAELLGNISNLVNRFSQLARKTHTTALRNEDRDELSIFDRAAAILSLTGTCR